MSVFTKRRKKLRQQQKIELKQKEENSKKFEKAMQDHIETCKIIKRDYPGYDNMNRWCESMSFNYITVTKKATIEEIAANKINTQYIKSKISET